MREQTNRDVPTVRYGTLSTARLPTAARAGRVRRNCPDPPQTTGTFVPQAFAFLSAITSVWPLTAKERLTPSGAKGITTNRPVPSGTLTADKSVHLNW